MRQHARLGGARGTGDPASGHAPRDARSSAQSALPHRPQEFRPAFSPPGAEIRFRLAQVGGFGTDGGPVKREFASNPRINPAYALV